MITATKTAAVPSSTRAGAAPLRWVLVILSLASLGQAVIIFDGYILSWSTRLWELRDLPARDRSGHLYEWFGPEATEFSVLLRQTVPESALVIVPSNQKAGELRYPELWQYFLFPRRVIGCESTNLEQCLAGWDLATTYVVEVDSVPGARSIPTGLRYQRFGDHFGLYAPAPPE